MPIPAYDAKSQLRALFGSDAYDRIRTRFDAPIIDDVSLRRTPVSPLFERFLGSIAFSTFFLLAWAALSGSPIVSLSTGARIWASLGTILVYVWSVVGTITEAAAPFKLSPARLKTCWATGIAVSAALVLPQIFGFYVSPVPFLVAGAIVIAAALAVTAALVAVGIPILILSSLKNALVSVFEAFRRPGELIKNVLGTAVFVYVLACLLRLRFSH